jgi:hypothetical protein
MIEVSFLIPVAGNDGVAFTAAHHFTFEAGLLRRFGGFTRLPGTTHGGWRNDAGVVFTDACLVYVVGVAGVLGAASDIRATAAFARGHYAQEAIAVRYLGTLEVL